MGLGKSIRVEFVEWSGQNGAGQPISPTGTREFDGKLDSPPGLRRLSIRGKDGGFLRDGGRNSGLTPPNTNPGFGQSDSGFGARTGAVRRADEISGHRRRRRRRRRTPLSDTSQTARYRRRRREHPRLRERVWCFD